MASLFRDRIRFELKEAVRRHMELYGPPLGASSSSSGSKPPVDGHGLSMAAFKMIDLNGSGNISSQEFADGISRLGASLGYAEHRRPPKCRSKRVRVSLPTRDSSMCVCVCVAHTSRRPPPSGRRRRRPTEDPALRGLLPPASGLPSLTLAHPLPPWRRGSRWPSWSRSRRASSQGGARPPRIARHRATCGVCVCSPPPGR